MIDLSRQPRKQETEPEDWQIVMLIIAVVLWGIILIGSML